MHDQHIRWSKNVPDGMMCAGPFIKVGENLNYGRIVLRWNQFTHNFELCHEIIDNDTPILALIGTFDSVEGYCSMYDAFVNAIHRQIEMCR